MTSPGVSNVLVLLPGGEKAMAILAVVKQLLILEMNFVFCIDIVQNQGHQELNTVLLVVVSGSAKILHWL